MKSSHASCTTGNTGLQAAACLSAAWRVEVVRSSLSAQYDHARHSKHTLTYFLNFDLNFHWMLFIVWPYKSSAIFAVWSSCVYFILWIFQVQLVYEYCVVKSKCLLSFCIVIHGLYEKLGKIELYNLLPKKTLRVRISPNSYPNPYPNP